MANIAFTDNIGAATLTNGKPAPGDRFGNWVPLTEPYGDAANRQSDGALTMFRFRDDYGVSFELAGIPARTASGVAPIDVADRLCYWLKAGGTCAVNTADALANSYPTCGLMPGTKPDLKLTDRAMLEYTLTLSLINLAGSPVRMVCRYDDFNT